jgi:endonuclease/exonuclease/phosphatase (EEP) superfamily protein YafD
MRFVLGLLRALTALLIVAIAVPALLALAGWVVPILDVLNHLQLLLFFGALGAAVLALLLRMRRGWVLLAFAGLLASGWTFAPVWLASIQPRPAAAAGAVTIKVMTHNIFGLNYDMERVAAVIAAEDPDIVALQEYFPEQARLGDLLKARYPYAVRCRGGKRANLGLYSKIPFDKEMTTDDCPSNARGGQRTAHILAGFTLSNGARFSLLTTHMDWPVPIDRQRDEFAATAEAIAAIAGPLLVVGDFNSTPWSYALRGFAAETGLRNEADGLPTYPVMVTVPNRLVTGGLMDTIPFLPLDQVFQRGMVVHELHAATPTGSDHLPVVFTMSVAP